MLVECVEFRAINNDYLKAIAKIRLPEYGMLVSDIKLLCKDGKFWCSWPDREYKNAQGEKKYYKIIHFEDKEKGRQIMKDAEAALQKKFEEIQNERSSLKRQAHYSFDHAPEF